MTRETILPPAGDGDSQDDDRDLRPQRMQEMVGQREVYARLEIAVDAASKRGEPLGHILFDGPPGLGKTTFAMCIPRDLGVSFQIGSGAALKAPKDVVPYLTNAEEGSVLFIDEIHRMQKAVEEFLYPAMEDFRIDLTLGEGVNARTLNIQLKPFTLIGATTRTGLISAPLRDRFQMREHLDFYTVEELAEIVSRNAGKLRVGIDDEAAHEIANRSRGTPRLANSRLRWVRDICNWLRSVVTLFRAVSTVRWAWSTSASAPTFLWNSRWVRASSFSSRARCCSASSISEAVECSSTVSSSRLAWAWFTSPSDRSRSSS